MESSHEYRFEQIEEGFQVRHSYTISQSVYDSFLRAFDDRSPIHVDDAHAGSAGFRGRVMHGAILNGFVSHFVGMVFPGRYALLLGVDLRFLNPCYLDDHLVISATVTQKVESQNVIVLNLRIEKQGGEAVASGRVQVKVRNA